MYTTHIVHAYTQHKNTHTSSKFKIKQMHTYSFHVSGLILQALIVVTRNDHAERAAANTAGGLLGAPT